MRPRLWGARALLAVASVLLVLGALAVWVQRVVLDTPTWTATSGRVFEDPAVQQALSIYLVDQLYANVDIAGELRGALPPRARPLAAPLAASLRDPLVRGAGATLASPRAHALWRVASSNASRQLIALLDHGGGVLRSSDGEVVLDLHLLLERVAGTSAAETSASTLPQAAGRIVLLKANQLQAAQDVARVLRAIALLLVPLVAALLALAIWLAPDRRAAVRDGAIGFLLGALVLVLLRRVIGGALIGRLVQDETLRPAAHSVWWIATEELRLEIASILAVGVAGLLGAGFAGPGAHVTSLRRVLAPHLLARRAYVALGSVALVLVAWSPTPVTRNWIAVLVLGALAVAGFEALRRQMAREQARAPGGEAGA
jgi:hypothetical protein